MLTGYKTYILAIVIIALALLHSRGYLDDSSYQTLLTILSGGTAITLAAKVNRVEKKL